MGAAGSAAIKADAKTAAIATALRKRQLLAFVYDGQSRAVEPHIYGLGAALRPGRFIRAAPLSPAPATARG